MSIETPEQLAARLAGGGVAPTTSTMRAALTGAIRADREQIVAALEAEAVEIESWGRRGGYVLGDQSACAALREFAARLRGTS